MVTGNAAAPTSGSEAGVITEASGGGVSDRVLPRIGYVAFCQVVPDCGRADMVGNLREGLGKVVDVVDLWGQHRGREAACDAVLAMDCAISVTEPYFIYLCSERDDSIRPDPTTYRRAVGVFAENHRLAECLVQATGISRAKIHVILPAVTARHDLPSIPAPRLRQAPRRRLLLRVSDGCAQQLRAEAVRCVLDALQILRSEYDARIHLLISGVESWPLTDTQPDGVSVCGVSARGETALLDSHDILVVPAGPEFAGLPEALSRGVPCVVDRRIAMSEAITSGVTGAVIDGKDAREVAKAIASVLSNDEVYYNCYERASAMAAYFSWERVARQVAYVISREVGFTM